jgi:hypothetical protein
VEAELILFTLDFATGNRPLPRVAIGGVTYNDDEEDCDWGHEFDCFEIAALNEIDDCHSLYPPGSNLGLRSVTGHLEMFSQPIATANDSHDVLFGNGDNTRNRGFHGWIAQNVSLYRPPPDFGPVLAGDEPIPGTPVVGVPVGTGAAWGRPLAQSTTDLAPEPGDEDPVPDVDAAGP